jgi:hypothetical protein
MSLTARGLLAMLLALPAAGAQVGGTSAPRREVGGQMPPIVTKVVGVVMGAFANPVHLVIGGVAPGSGFGAGIGFDTPSDKPWTFEAKAIGTVRRYWALSAEAGYGTSRTRVDFYGRRRDMPQLAFYGLGNDSRKEDRTSFGMRETVAGALASARVAPWVTLGARAEENWTNLGAGRPGEFPSIGAQFAPADVPGLAGRGKYARYEASVDVRVPAALGKAFYQGARYRVAYAYFDDQVSNQFSFSRLDVEAQQRFTMPIPQHILTLHGWASFSTADGGQSVPFYLQRTLGGKSFVRSVHDNIIGSDGSRGTLRGFSELRFRDRNVLLLQAEYRVPVWGLIDATVYADAGKVAYHRSDLDFTGLKHNFGLSVSAMGGDVAAARVDLAFGGEGTRLFFTIGFGVTQ